MSDAPKRIIKQQHEFQAAFLAFAVTHVVRVAAFFGGLQSGKSVAGADALEQLLYGPACLKLPPQAKGQIPEVWILSKSYVLAQAALNTFRWRGAQYFLSDKDCRELGLKRGDQNSYWLKPSVNGDCAPIMLRVRTAHDPEALRATPVLLAAWCDEMAHWPEMAWLNLQGRGIVTRTKYIITTTPKGKNWLYYDVCLPGEAKEGDTLYDPEIRTVKCRSVDNPWADEKYLRGLRKKFGENYAQQELDGLFISSSGLVYPAFDKQKHLRHLPSHDPANFPVRIIGVDPGYGDPYACVVLLRDKDRKWWIAEEFYLQNAITSDLIPWFKSQALKWDIQRVFVDKRRPADTQELQKHNIKAIANYELYAENDRRTILPMVRVVEAIFREERFGGVNPDCEWTIDEFENYSYPDREARNKGENPVDWKNHCVAGDTWIDTCNGRHQIRDLVGKEFYTWAFDVAMPRACKAKDVRLTRKAAPVVKITFDNSTLVLTEDHLVLKRDGCWMEAGKLKPGTRVRAFFQSRQVAGHLDVRTGTGATRYRAAHRLVWESVNGQIPNGYVIHHKDENKLNNDPSNLECMTKHDHVAIHHPMLVEAARKVRTGGGSWNKEDRPYSDCVICGKPFQQKKPQGQWRKTCSYGCHQKLRLNNHRVLSVEPYGVADVYNMEVDGLHNFVANGVCVHNCMDALRYGLVSIEGVNYEGPGQIFRSGKRGEFVGGKKQYKKIPSQPRSLGQAILDQEKADESKPAVRRF